MVTALNYYNKAVLLYKANNDKGALSFIYFMIGGPIRILRNQIIKRHGKYQKELIKWKIRNEFNGPAFCLIGSAYMPIKVM